jgi:hypothetical protein
MKPEELRIGNIVNCKINNTVIIINAITAFGINQEYGYSRFNYTEIEGTSITNKWMEKIGIADYENSYYIQLDKSDDIRAYYSEKMGLVMIKGGYTTISWYKHIRYIHQLQNLYHALTGEELSIEL